MIRALVPADLDQLAALETASARRPWSRTALTSMLVDVHTSGWISPPNAYLFGHQVLDEAEIHSVGVHPAARRRGHGRAMVTHALTSWWAGGVAVVHLEVRADNDAACALYTSLGFRTTGRRVGYYGDSDALLMAVTP